MLEAERGTLCCLAWQGPSAVIVGDQQGSQQLLLHGISCYCQPHDSKQLIITGLYSELMMMIRLTRLTLSQWPVSQSPPVSSWASDTVSSRDNLVSLHPPYCVDWRRHLGKDETHTNKTEIFTHQTTVTLSTGRRSKFTTVGPSLAYLCPLLRVRACPSCCIAFTGLELDLVVTVVKL